MCGNEVPNQVSGWLIYNYIDMDLAQSSNTFLPNSYPHLPNLAFGDCRLKLEGRK